MPTYCYRCEPCDITTEVSRSMAEASLPFPCPDCESNCVRDYQAEAGETRKSFQSGWPLYSDAAGVHPKQINDAVADSVKIGVPTQFTPDGRAIFTDRSHRKRYCEKKGLYDRNGGYGDPQPK